jgi:retinol-binding protein 3
MSDGELPITAGTRERLLDRVLATLADKYVFPDVAAGIATAIRTRAARGEYASITDGAAFAQLLTAHLRAAGHDNHLALYCSLEPRRFSPGYEPAGAELDRCQRAGALTNYGFRRLERLAGNVGYLRLDEFYPATDAQAADTASAAMTFLARTCALIIDLRENRGGDGSMTAFLAGHLFPLPVHMSTFRWRGEDTEFQSWTPAHVPAPRYLDRPVYLLTSAQTASAAEEFAYALRELDRVTVIGETTAGAAHATLITRLDAHFDLAVPQGRPIHPHTGNNWQGAGVTPDLAVPAAHALTAAYRAALAHVIAWASERDLGGLAADARAALQQLDVTASPPR